MAWFLTIGTSESQNPGANQSTVSAALYLNWNNADRYSGFSTSGHINIGGNIFPFTGPSSGGSTAQTGSTLLYSYPLTYNHDANGFRGAVGTSGFFDAAGTSTIAPQNLSVTGTTFGAIDYVRLPSAPSSVSAVATGPTVVVTSGEASTPGPTITSYQVSFASSSNGGATFGAWSAESAMTSRAFTYTLTPGLTYKFRVRAQNTDGFGPYRESSTLFLTAGGKRFTGTDWALTVNAAKRFNGTAWVDLTTARRYDGTNWVNLS